MNLDIETLNGSLAGDDTVRAFLGAFRAAGVRLGLANGEEAVTARGPQVMARTATVSPAPSIAPAAPAARVKAGGNLVEVPGCGWRLKRIAFRD